MILVGREGRERREEREGRGQRAGKEGGGAFPKMLRVGMIS